MFIVHRISKKRFHLFHFFRSFFRIKVFKLLTVSCTSCYMPLYRNISILDDIGPFSGVIFLQKQLYVSCLLIKYTTSNIFRSCPDKNNMRPLRTNTWNWMKNYRRLFWEMSVKYTDKKNIGLHIICLYLHESEVYDLWPAHSRTMNLFKQPRFSCLFWYLVKRWNVACEMLHFFQSS